MSRGLEARDSFGNTPLHTAASSGSIDAIEFLLKLGANPNAKTVRDVTPLLLAIQASNRSFEAVKMLIKAGASPSVGSMSTSPVVSTIGLRKWDILECLLENERPLIKYDSRLHAAARANHPALIDRFIGSGIDVDVLDDADSTPLHSACSSNQAEAVKALLAAGAAVTARGSHRSTVLHHCAINGADRALEAILPSLPQELLDAKNDDEATPLHVAAENNHANIMERLIVAGASTTATTRENMNALHLSSLFGNIAAAMVLVESNKVAVDATAANGVTALHLAAMQGHLFLVKYLVEKGASIDATTTHGHNVIDFPTMASNSRTRVSGLAKQAPLPDRVVLDRVVQYLQEKMREGRK